MATEDNEPTEGAAGAAFRAVQSDVHETLAIVRAMSIATSHNADRITALEHGHERHANQLAEDDQRIRDLQAARTAPSVPRTTTDNLTVRLSRPGSRARLALVAFALMLGSAGTVLAAQAVLR